jgi:PKD repeat protein
VQGANVTLNASASTDNDPAFPAGATFTWVVHDADGDVTLTGMAAVHGFDTMGRYTVELTVKDAANHTSTDELVVTVEDTEPPLIGEVMVGPYDEDVMTSVNLRAFITDNDPDVYATGDVAWTLKDPAGRESEVAGWSIVMMFTTPGVWRATIVATDAAGNSATATFNITVVDRTPPVASATAHPQGAAEDDPVSWDASASTDNDPLFPEGANLTWTFLRAGAPAGSEERAYGARPERTFATPGHYTVTLVVKDAGGNAATWTETLAVRDTTPPVVQRLTDDAVLEDTLVGFEAPGATDNDPAFPAGASWTWRIVGAIGGTFVMRGGSISFVFAAPDTYAVTVEVADAAGNVGSAAFNVSVLDTTAPAPASGLAAKGEGIVKTTITWSSPTDPDLAGFVIMRQKGDGAWTELVNLSGGLSNSYTDKDLAMGATYHYRIYAYDGSGNKATPAEVSYSAVEPVKKGYFPWWLIVVAFIVGLIIALLVEETRHKGKRKPEEAEEQKIEPVQLEPVAGVPPEDGGEGGGGEGGDGDGGGEGGEDASSLLEEIDGLEAVELEEIVEEGDEAG